MSNPKISGRQKIYIAGCGGMLGEAFYKFFKDDYDLHCTDIDINDHWLSYLDFRDNNAYSKDVNNFKPNWLFHLGAFTDLAIRDESILNLATKVTMELGSDLVSTKAGRQARVIIQMTQGPLYSQQVNAAKGGNVSPMSPEELRIKFKECATRVISPESADLLAEAISTLDTAPDLRLLTSLLTGDPA